jgi:hypothetical protein
LTEDLQSRIGRYRDYDMGGWMAPRTNYVVFAWCDLSEVREVSIIANAHQLTRIVKEFLNLMSTFIYISLL